MKLTVTDHDRGAAGLTYVYPVVSRRARGLSVGVNLNPNNACNWRCVYCQVPDLVRGAGPPIDLDALDSELRRFLDSVVRGDYLKENVPEEYRRLNDVALSGNGEPTTSPSLGGAIRRIEGALRDLDLLGAVKVVLITNGSMVGREPVDRAIRRIAALDGEVWFKLDSATERGTKAMNSASVDPERHLERLRRAARLCPTYVQTCVFSRNGEPPDEREQRAYLRAIAELAAGGGVKGVLLYGLARAPLQPEASELAALPRSWLEDFGRRIEGAGLPVRLSL